VIHGLTPQLPFGRNRFDPCAMTAPASFNPLMSVLSQGALLRAVGCSVRFLTALDDLRLLVVGSSLESLPLEQFCLGSGELVVPEGEESAGAGACLEGNAAIARAGGAVGGGEPLRAYYCLGGEAVTLTIPLGESSLPEGAVPGWHPLPTTLQWDWPWGAEGQGPRGDRGQAVVLGISDRFSVLLRASTLPKRTDQAAQSYQLALTFQPMALVQTCTHLQRQLQQRPALARQIEASLGRWPAQANWPELQSDYTLHLLAALDWSQTQHSLGDRHAARTVTQKIAQRIRQRYSSAIAAPISSEDRPWMQQGQLLQRLLDASNPTFGPQGCLRRAAEAIREFFAVGCCQIVFYCPKTYRPRWSTAARDPALLGGDRPWTPLPWGAIERAMRAAADLPMGVTDSPLDLAPGAVPPEATLTSWIRPEVPQPDTWVAGAIALEEWARSRSWQPAEMYLLQMAVQQVEQSLYQAVLYQQAEERFQRTSLLGQLAAQIRSSLDLSQIFETATAALAQLLLVDRCAIACYLEPQECWQVVSEHRTNLERPSTLGLSVPDRANPYATALKHRQVVQLADAHDGSGPQSSLRRSLRDRYPGAWLLVPIHYGDCPWGALAFNQEGYARHWHDSEVSFLCTVADQLAIAIHQATLYQQRAQGTAMGSHPFDRLPIPMVIVAADGETAIATNGALRRLVRPGVRPLALETEGAPRSLADLLPAAAAAQTMANNRQALAEASPRRDWEFWDLGQGHPLELEVERLPFSQADGARSLLCLYRTLGPMADGGGDLGGEGGLPLNDNVTYLREALRVACEASALKGACLGQASSNLRGALTSVIGMSSALQQQIFGPLNPKQEEYVRIIYESGTHLLATLNRQLSLKDLAAQLDWRGRDRLPWDATIRLALRQLGGELRGWTVHFEPSMDPEILGGTGGQVEGYAPFIRQAILGAIAAALQEDHGGVRGDLWLYSRFKGAYATLRIMVPSCSTAIASGWVEASPEPSGPPQGPTAPANDSPAAQGDPQPRDTPPDAQPIASPYWILSVQLVDLLGGSLRQDRLSDGSMILDLTLPGSPPRRSP